MNTKQKLLLLFIILIIFNKKFKLKESFYGWIPIPTRNFRYINSDLRDNYSFIAYNNKGIPIYYDKYSNRLGYGNKGFLGSFILGLFPYHFHNYNYNYF